MMRLGTYSAGGKIVNPSQGKIDGERIDVATEKALEAFWASFSESFPEVETGDMGPGDVDALEDAASRTVRVWLMWNHPDGMPDDIDQNETPPPFLNVCLFEHTEPTAVVQTPEAGPYAGQGLCEEHYRAAQQAGDIPEDDLSQFDHPVHSIECINGGQVGCIPGCPGLNDGGFLAKD